MPQSSSRIPETDQQEPAFNPVHGPGKGPSQADKNGFVLRLAVFCQQIKSTKDRPLDAGHHLSDEGIRLVSCLYDFMQARIDACPTAVAEGETPEPVNVARHRLAALTELNEALATANPFAILGIAAFAVLEVCDSAFGEWECHLRGARSLLDYHCQSQPQLDQLSLKVTGLTEIVARLAWFDTMGAVVRGATGLIFDDWHRDLLNDSFFDVVGCAADTFQLYSDVAKGGVAVDPMGSCFRAMDQLLKLDSHATDWTQSANINRCAAALAVLEKMTEDTAMMRRHEAILSAVNTICQLIASATPSSPFYIHMASAVHLAGMNATTAQHCVTVRAYWQGCNLADVPRYPGGLSRCQDEWRARGIL
ncbi:hypothetical protein QQZ08_011919 [Neonectria magnoliae]|uniref:Uncharacterized protein n=1 Tax=Neonectria magnoliae TaxID=2732573 RepID=A0ABR1H6B5_9HYPO